jgi:restriction endonuclease Mrr
VARIKVQVKRTTQRIDLQTLNSFLAIIDKDDVGLYVSTGGFTKDAADAARNQTGRKITLIDLEPLQRFLNIQRPLRVGSGLSSELRHPLSAL